jgi:acetyltransferase-like isoleucine patch superfamily enzyme
MVSFRGVLGEQVKQILLRLGFLNLYEHAVYGDSTRVKLGKSVSLDNAILNVASGRITIGDHVIFGHGVILTTGTHNYRKAGIDRVEVWLRSGCDIVIEDGVMIGSGATILGKVRVR